MFLACVEGKGRWFGKIACYNKLFKTLLEQIILRGLKVTTNGVSSHQFRDLFTSQLLMLGANTWDKSPGSDLLCEGTFNSSDRSGKQRSSCRCLSIKRAELSSASASAVAGLLAPGADGMAGKTTVDLPGSQTETCPSKYKLYRLRVTIIHC